MSRSIINNHTKPYYDNKCENKCENKHKNKCESKHKCKRIHRGPTGPCCMGATGAIGHTGPDGKKGDTGPDGKKGDTGPAGTTSVIELAGFFGMTAGPGNDTPTTDYAATIAISGPSPSVTDMSALNFPRLMHPTIGGIIIGNIGSLQSDNTDFILPSVGIYRVTWHVSVDESVQWSLWISTNESKAPIPYTGPTGLFSVIKTALGSPSQIGQATGTSQLSGNITFFNSVAGSAIQVRNNGSRTPVTITPLPGGTNAQAVCLTIQRLA